MSVSTAHPPMRMSTQKRAAVQKAVRRIEKITPAKQSAEIDNARRINSRAQLRQIMERKDHDGSRLYLITPELAGWLLELNSGNRRMARARVERYRHIVSHGLWINTGEPIIVSDKGILNEGQHRLMAIKEAGIAVPCDIRFGISRKAFPATGTGAMRTAANVLEIEGEIPYTLNVAAAARLLLQYEMGLPSSLSITIVSQEILAAVHRWKADLVTAAKMVSRLNTLHGQRFAQASTIAFTVLALRQKNEATVSEFLEVAASGLAQNADNPARRLYDRLRREQDSPGYRHNREAGAERLALFIIAWQAWLRNETLDMRDLRWRTSNAGTNPFPMMEGVKL